MELELNRSYLLRRKELNYRADIEEFRLVRESLTSYKFKRFSYGKPDYNWIEKTEFEKTYDIIEALDFNEIN